MLNKIRSTFGWSTSFQLIPQASVEPSDGHFRWKSTEQSPCFALGQGRLSAGWYILNLQLNSSVTRLNSTLYVDYGSGFSETDVITLPLTSGKLAKRVCYLHSKPEALRFDPVGQVCEFSVNEIRMDRLTAPFARKLMLKKLNARSTTDVDACLSDHELLKAYDSCFQLCQGTLTYPQSCLRDFMISIRKC